MTKKKLLGTLSPLTRINMNKKVKM